MSGGAHARRLLPVPEGVRPTEGRVREALISMWGQDLSGLRCLDLFTGSGVMSLELIGRGAERVVTVEGDPRVARAVRAEFARLGIAGVEVLEGRLPAALERLLRPDDRFDRLFADPPYDYKDYPGLLTVVAPWMAPEAELIVELSRRSPLPAVPELEALGCKKYGETQLVRYRLAS